MFARGLEFPFKHEVGDLEIVTQLFKIDMLISFFIELFNASKEIALHTIELNFGLQTALVEYVD